MFVSSVVLKRTKTRHAEADRRCHIIIDRTLCITKAPVDVRGRRRRPRLASLVSSLLEEEEESAPYCIVYSSSSSSVLYTCTNSKYVR